MYVREDNGASSTWGLNQWCCEAPTVPNGVRVWPDTHPDALGKRMGKLFIISTQKRPVNADKLRASPSVLH